MLGRGSVRWTLRTKRARRPRSVARSTFSSKVEGSERPPDLIDRHTWLKLHGVV